MIAEDNILHFTLFCIYAIAGKYNKTSAYIFNIFEKFGVSSYIANFYNVLHTQGKSYIIYDIEDYIKARGGEIS